MKATTEECLRYDFPVKSIQRIASEDVEMRGKLLRKNDRVRWFISSANRDPDSFPEAETFDIARHPNQHVAFGWARIIASAQRSRAWKARRCSGRWRNVSPGCA